MVIKYSAEGYDTFSKVIKDLEAKSDSILVLFSGSKSDDGQSWCPDCVSAEPVINEVLENIDDKTYFLYVGVGDRSTWKDPNCVFRKDERLRLSSVPTLVRWGKPNRLEEEKCCIPDLIRLLLEDD